MLIKTTPIFEAMTSDENCIIISILGAMINSYRRSCRTIESFNGSGSAVVMTVVGRLNKILVALYVSLIYCNESSVFLSHIIQPRTISVLAIGVLALLASSQ